MSTIALKSATRRVRSYTHKVEGDYWTEHIQMAQAADAEYHADFRQLSHMAAIPQEVAQAIMRLHCHHDEQAAQVRALAQIGSGNA